MDLFIINVGSHQHQQQQQEQQHCEKTHGRRELSTPPPTLNGVCSLFQVKSRLFYRLALNAIRSNARHKVAY